MKIGKSQSELSHKHIFKKWQEKKVAINFAKRQLYAYCAIYHDIVQQLGEPGVDANWKVDKCSAAHAYCTHNGMGAPKNEYVDDKFFSFSISRLPTNEYSQ